MSNFSIAGHKIMTPAEAERIAAEKAAAEKAAKKEKLKKRLKKAGIIGAGALALLGGGYAGKKIYGKIKNKKKTSEAKNEPILALPDKLGSKLGKDIPLLDTKYSHVVKNSAEDYIDDLLDTIYEAYYNDLIDEGDYDALVESVYNAEDMEDIYDTETLLEACMDEYY